jgi:hypothetical protein
LKIVPDFREVRIEAFSITVFPVSSKIRSDAS